MRLVVRMLEEAAYVVDRLATDHTLEIFGLEITTQKQANTRGHTAFQLGVEAGASGLVQPKPEPRPARVLQLVR